MSSYGVINKNARNVLVLKIVDADSAADAVRRRVTQLGGPDHAKILFVSNPVPSSYGTGGAQLYPVRIAPPPPQGYEVLIGGNAVTFDDLDDYDDDY